MCKWTEQVIDALIERAAEDEFYQQILNKNRLAEKDYLRIQKKLSSKFRSDLDNYIAYCEELQYQLVRIAYEYGWESGYDKRKGR